MLQKAPNERVCREQATLGLPTRPLDVAEGDLLISQTLDPIVRERHAEDVGRQIL
jgi:hypothetical protein